MSFAQGNPATVPAQNLRPRAGRAPATAASDGGSDGGGGYGQPDAENLSFLELLAFEDDDGGGGGGYHQAVPTTVVRRALLSRGSCYYHKVNDSPARCCSS
jgi:hypothetical protein